MGGRGATIPEAIPGGGGRKGNGSMDLNPGSASTLSEALGKQGRPMSVSRAVLGANPFYDKNYDEYSMNCQRVVTATEARFRGYDVIALPTYNNDTMIYGDNWASAYKGAKVESVGKRTAGAAQKALENKMKEYGDGSRAVMSMLWKGKDNGGHVINVIQKNGKTYYYDGQVGKKYNGKELFRQIQATSATITRVDNLEFSDTAKETLRTKPKKK